MFLSRTVIAALFFLTSAALADGPSSQTFSGEVTLKVGYNYLLSLPEGYEADTVKNGRCWFFFTARVSVGTISNC